MSELDLRSTRFRREREGHWRALEALIAKCERGGTRSLTADELHDLPVLYRAAVSSLSVARSISLDRNVVDYLEGLATRAYFQVYSPRRRAHRVAMEFFARSFPRAVRDLRGWMFLAAAIFAIGAATGYGMTVADLDNYYLFVDPTYAAGRDPAATTEDLLAVIFNQNGEHRQGVLGYFATRLFAGNSQVGLLCYAVGIVPLVLVALVMFQNATLLGAFYALHAEHGIAVEFSSWVLPHGVTELLAVILCGGAGLSTGLAVVFPGRLTRLESLLRAGRRAGTVAIGCVAMFFVAALIEGFFRQLVNDVAIRFAVVAATAAFWTWYFGRVGRGEEVGA